MLNDLPLTIFSNNNLRISESTSLDLVEIICTEECLKTPVSNSQLKEICLALRKSNMRNVLICQKSLSRLFNDVKSLKLVHLIIELIKTKFQKIVVVISLEIVEFMTFLSEFGAKLMCSQLFFFFKKEGAFNWLAIADSNVEIKPYNPDEISFDIDRSLFSIKANQFGQVPQVFVSYLLRLSQYEASQKRLSRLSCLTKTENKVLQMYTSGSSFKEIADLTFTSVHTVRTHWRNLKRKLDISTVMEAMNYREF